MVFLVLKNAAAGPILKIAAAPVKKRKTGYRLGISRIKRNRQNCSLPPPSLGCLHGSPWGWKLPLTLRILFSLHY